MAFEIVRLHESHVPSAARLVAQGCAALRERVPAVPPRYESPDVWSSRLRRLLGRGVGVAAFEGGRMVGFLAGYSIGLLRGRPCVLSPEWAHAAEASVSRRVFEALYPAVAPEWLRLGGEFHVICTLAHDASALQGWAWAGFGHMVCDALRPLAPISVSPGGIDVRRMTATDLEQVLPLACRLAECLAAPPVYVLDRESEDSATWEADLGDPRTAVWMAVRRGRTVGYLRQTPATEDACDVIVDEGTTSITGVYVVPDARREGVAAALLARAVDWGREQGYVRCSVDFETANSPAARLWLQYFTPVVVSLGRTLDPRLVAG